LADYFVEELKSYLLSYRIADVLYSAEMLIFSWAVPVQILTIPKAALLKSSRLIPKRINPDNYCQGFLFI